jgi:hypothetical protein
VDIEAHLRTYLSARQPSGRYASFDYCFNYFQGFREGGAIGDVTAPANLQLSCLHLGFYLASWGMLRGSSVLLRKSLSYYVPVIEAIAKTDAGAWEIDANCYTEPNIATLTETAHRLRSALSDGASDILVTKIMLGVFGCVPAFDTYFRSGFGA